LTPFVLATRNAHKTGEIRRILEDVPVEILSLADLNVDIDVVEDGDTYTANALKKAWAAARATGMAAISDDSGIEVDALDGAPGIRSSRFAGEDATDEENNLLLLSMLEGVPESERGARFVCAAVLVLPQAPEGENEIVCPGQWYGRIGYRPRGDYGFGYDPLFIVPEEEATVAELGEPYKRSHSHRSKAFRALAVHLEAFD
jgi:XTP/dITP diphosphohydrolase